MTSARITAVPVVEPETPRKRRPSLPALTGMRYFAAAAVVAHHLWPQAGPWSPPPFVEHAFQQAGDASVSFFFMLSGFILVYSDIDDRGEMVKTRRAFWWARFARVYPMYLLGFLLTAPFLYVELSVRHHSAIGALERMALYGPAAFFLVQAWFPWTAISWNGPGWSLSNEAFFYAMFPLLGRFMRRLTMRPAVAVLALCWLLAALPELLLHTVYGSRTPPQLMGMVVRFDPLLRLPDFFGGMMTGMIFLRRRAQDGAASGLYSWISWLSVAALGAAIVFESDAMHHAVLFPIYVALIYSLGTGSSLLSRALGWTPLVRLGEASYSMYILHAPLYPLAMLLMGQPPLAETTKAGPVALYLVVITGIALLAHRYIEQPANRALRKRQPGSLQALSQEPRVTPVGR